MINNKKIIIISAINLRSGGTLSILNDCLKFADQNLFDNYRIIALVHKIDVVINTSNIEFLEFPKSISSYLYRLYYEYIYFKKISNKLKPYLWLSLHDMSPNVNATIQAVYCHNPSPFYKLRNKEVLLDIKFFLFTIFYKYLYRINIEKNDYVIVQQEWLREEFSKMYPIKKCIVAYPKISSSLKNEQNYKKDNDKIFFYPSFPRVFKNFEIICEAVKELNRLNIKNFEVIITIDGYENKYSDYIYNKYKNEPNIKFIGLQTRENVFNLYSEADCLIFPSKLETWGLPISEFKEFNKPMILADLQFSHETIGEYDKVSFFNSNDSFELAKKMKMFLENSLIFKYHRVEKPSQPFAENWYELFKILLKEEETI
ncbi:glycosyltransferase [Aliarcobacter cryaerophilus]|uniref:glycosyltransferase n=1 Tax=Aliarcobacter cryaerophilus TaxID=28198 RepID=UPI0021B6E4FE|nr:glycosyltransferase [Aliarcobacter cryaerophilus]MCT7487106.1 glycosyltransferase [Aliarcobacter cryaerophilus]MCT7491580.1 glycosyltransferase [Aliarcobacter cryaerophilus]